MSDDIEVPRRGYDTKDVETMTQAIESSGRRGVKKILAIVILLVLIGAAAWLILSR